MTSMDHQVWSHRNITQVSIASFSFLASTLIAWMIAGPKSRGLSSPYRRVIFGLSISDMMQSFSLLFAPWSIEEYYKGSKGACRTAGFLLIIGATALPMYTCLLCLYYFCKLKQRMSNETFCNKIERRVHVIIVLVNLTIASVAVGMETIHPNETESVCGSFYEPKGCNFRPDLFGECNQETATLIVSCCVLSLVALCLFGSIWILAYLLRHANSVWLEEEARNVLRSITGSSDEGLDQSSASAGERGGENVDEHDNLNDTVHSTPQEQLRNLSRLYRDEVTIQASCYVGSFCLVYIPIAVPYIYVIFTSKIPSIMLWFAVVTYPLGGLFNILIYTRPKVASLRRDYPACSRLQGLWLVIKAGGEVPTQWNGGNSSAFDCCCSPFHFFPRLPAPEAGNAGSGHGRGLEEDGIVIRPSAQQQDSISDLPSSISQSSSAQSSLPNSVEGIDGLSGSFSDDSLRYRPHADWMYVQGEGSQLNAIQEKKSEEEK